MNILDALNGYANGGFNGMAGTSPLTSGALSQPYSASVPSLLGPQEGFGGGIGGIWAPGGSIWDKFLSKDGQQGWGGPALQGAGALASMFMSMKQYGLAKDTLAQNKLQFDTNYAAQKGLTNASLEDRQRARVASNPGAYQSVGDYMAANGVK